jgi:cell division protein ZapE
VLTLNGPVDYRLERLTGIATWHMPLGEAATQRVREVFFRLTDYPPEDAANVPSLDMDVGGGACCMCPRA